MTLFHVVENVEHTIQSGFLPDKTALSTWEQRFVHLHPSRSWSRWAHEAVRGRVVTQRDWHHLLGMVQLRTPIWQMRPFFPTMLQHLPDWSVLVLVQHRMGHGQGTVQVRVGLGNDDDAYMVQCTPVLQNVPGAHSAALIPVPVYQGAEVADDEWFGSVPLAAAAAAGTE